MHTPAFHTLRLTAQTLAAALAIASPVLLGADDTDPSPIAVPKLEKLFGKPTGIAKHTLGPKRDGDVFVWENVHPGTCTAYRRAGTVTSLEVEYESDAALGPMAAPNWTAASLRPLMNDFTDGRTWDSIGSIPDRKEAIEVLKRSDGQLYIVTRPGFITISTEADFKNTHPDFKPGPSVPVGTQPAAALMPAPPATATTPAPAAPASPRVAAVSDPRGTPDPRLAPPPAPGTPPAPTTAQPPAPAPAPKPATTKPADNRIRLSFDPRAAPRAAPKPAPTPAPAPPTPAPDPTPSLPWPALAGELRGPAEVRVFNPNPFTVKIGIRSGRQGRDLDVRPLRTKIVPLPPGHYDLFTQNQPGTQAVRQSPSFDLTAAGADISLPAARVPAIGRPPPAR